MTWMIFAECREYDPEMFFPVSDEGTALGQAQRAQAKAVCGACPVRFECLAFALDTEDPRYPFGIFGGLTESERQKIHAGRKVAAGPLLMIVIREGADLREYACAHE